MQEGHRAERRDRTMARRSCRSTCSEAREEADGGVEQRVALVPLHVALAVYVAQAALGAPLVHQHGAHPQGDAQHPHEHQRLRAQRTAEIGAQRIVRVAEDG